MDEVKGLWLIIFKCVLVEFIYIRGGLVCLMYGGIEVYSRRVM